MLTFNPNKSNCTGCAACYSVCPTHCISMDADEEGFLYPNASDACVHCGLCETVCPAILPKANNNYVQKAVAAVSKDYEIWKRSSSGGAFSEICRQWADDDTLIVGAAWDGLKVHHIGVYGFENIAPLCKSKYISSAIEDSFIEIRNELRGGRKTIFCGCPCQVAGLKAFLGKDYNNLLTIDLICHGQGSPIVFTYLLWIDISYYQIPSEKFASDLRNETGLFIYGGPHYGNNGEGYIRMNVATSLANVKDALNRLKLFLKNKER